MPDLAVESSRVPKTTLGEISTTCAHADCPGSLSSRSLLPLAFSRFGGGARSLARHYCRRPSLFWLAPLPEWPAPPPRYSATATRNRSSATAPRGVSSATLHRSSATAPRPRPTASAPRPAPPSTAPRPCGRSSAAAALVTASSGFDPRCTDPHPIATDRGSIFFATAALNLARARHRERCARCRPHSISLRACVCLMCLHHLPYPCADLCLYHLPYPCADSRSCATRVSQPRRRCDRVEMPLEGVPECCSGTRARREPRRRWYGGLRRRNAHAIRVVSREIPCGVWFSFLQ